ncbi:MAG: FHA domain-containing protein [Planctomycetota bacterium]
MQPRDTISLSFSGSLEGTFLLGAAEDLLVGRSLQARLPLDDTCVSRRHCRLWIGEGGRVWVEDLASANGTFVNGRRVERSRLRTGDVLEVGGTRLEVRLSADADTPATGLPRATAAAGTPTLHYAASDVAGRLGEVGYVLEECLSRNGLVAVYRARSTKLSTPVAIKVLLLRGPVTRTQIDHFAHGVEAHASLRYARVPRVLDVRRGPDLVAVVMELVDGATLARAIARRGTLSSWQALRLGYQVGEALRYVHAQGVVHRDVSPRNLMLTPDGEVRLIDFGLAAARGAAQPGVGTPGFRAPEQARGEPVDERADLYGLGATLLYALTGVAPPRDGAPDVAAAGPLQPLLARLVAADPTGRFSGAAEFLAAIQTLTGELSGLPADSSSTEFLLRLAADEPPTHRWHKGNEGAEGPPTTVHSRAAMTRSQDPPALRGRVQELELVNLLQLAERTKMTGRLVISAPGGRSAVLIVREGRLIRALCRDLSGAAAARAALQLVPASFTFHGLPLGEARGEDDLTIGRILLEHLGPRGDDSAA